VKRLNYAKAAVESPYGLIESGWTKTDSGIIYNISIPVGSKASIYLPASASRITENGQPVEIVEEKNGYVQIIATSGKYRFEAIHNN
jgi:alpha-L-rhamnosidase